MKKKNISQVSKIMWIQTNIIMNIKKPREKQWRQKKRANNMRVFEYITFSL